MVVDAEHGTVDSPLHPDQVEIIPGVPEALSRLTRAGWGLAIVSNQPSSAKGKTSKENLEKTHQRIVELIQAAGGRISSSHICYHRSEDKCSCRKPRTGLLEEAFRQNPSYAKPDSWMVGDGITDVQAGQSFGLKTALLADHKLETAELLRQKQASPTVWAKDLADFCRETLKI